MVVQPKQQQQLLHAETLEHGADSAEFCPHPSLQHVLAVGTYQLLEERQERVGQCLLYALQQQDEHEEEACGSSDRMGAAARPRLRPVGRADVPGVFDLKWGTLGGRPVLGAALADGSVRLFEAPEVGGGGS